jgi:hypothetical protein
MAEARDRAEWQRTAWLLCHVLNAMNFDEHAERLEPGDCNPYVLQDREKSGPKSQQFKGTVIPYDPKILIARQEAYLRMKRGDSPPPPNPEVQEKKPLKA